VICHVIVPGPEESLAFPVHVPLTLAGCEEGSLGDVVLLPPPLHAMVRQATANTATKTLRADAALADTCFINWMSQFSAARLLMPEIAAQKLSYW
jgi:hypothetical protein